MADYRDVVLIRRVADLRRFLRWRYRHVMPDDDAARDDLAVLVRHLVDMPNGANVAENAIQMWAPWMESAEATATIASAQDMSILKIMFDAHEMGVRLGLTDEIREELGIRSIEACDVTPTQRKEINREKRRVKAQHDRARKRAKKAAALSQRAAAIIDAITTSNDWQSVAEVVEAVKNQPPFLFAGKVMPKESARKAVFRECRKLAESGHLRSDQVITLGAPTYFVFSINFGQSRETVPGTSKVTKKAVGA